MDVSHDERAELLRQARSTPRPGSIEEAEALDAIDNARTEEANRERQEARRQDRFDRA